MTTIAELILRSDHRQIDDSTGALDRMTHAGGRASSMLLEMAGAVGIAFGVKEIFDAAEAYTKIANRLALVTNSSEQLAAAQQQLFDIAQKTRAPVEATAEVYQRLATNAGALGLTLNEVGRTTETINKLMAISGTSAQSADAALVQLGQAFASGTLRGEELNSVLEQAPALAGAIAAGMGVTVGELRKLGEQGKLTSAAVVDALNKQADAVDASFAKMAPTISQGATLMKNSFTQMIGQMDKVSGASSMLGQAMAGMSKMMDSGAAVETMARLFGTWGAVINDVYQGLGSVHGSMSVLSNDAATLGGDIVSAFIEMPANVKAMLSVVGSDIGYFIESTDNRFKRAKDRWHAIWNDDSTIAGANKAYEQRQKILDDTHTDHMQAILDERDAEIKAGRDRAKAAKDARKTNGSLLDAGGGPAKASTAIDEKAVKERQKRLDDDRKLFDDAEKQENDSYQRRLKELDWFAEQSKMSAENRAATELRIRTEHENAIQKIRIDPRLQYEQQIADQMDFLGRQGEAEQQNYLQRKAKTEEMFGTAVEVENLNYQQRLLDLQSFFDEYNTSEDQQRLYREKAEQDHMQRMNAARLADESNNKRSLTSKLGTTQSIMNSLYTITGSHNQRMLKAAQIAGAAQATINAYTAASQALSDPTLPWYAKVAAALSVLSTGIGFANAIQGGGSAAGGGGAASASTPDTSGITPAQQPVRPQTVDFRIESRGRRGWDDAEVADLMQVIGSRVADGAKFGRVEFVTA